LPVGRSLLRRRSVTLQKSLLSLVAPPVKVGQASRLPLAGTRIFHETETGLILMLALRARPGRRDACPTLAAQQRLPYRPKADAGLFPYLNFLFSPTSLWQMIPPRR